MISTGSRASVNFFRTVSCEVECVVLVTSRIFSVIVWQALLEIKLMVVQSVFEKKENEKKNG